MKNSPDLLALQHIQAVCHGHAEALSEALQDMQLRALTLENYSHLSKADRRLLDQFAYRYTRLQDDMGARLMPPVLKALGEDVAHDYPDSPAERFDRRQAATQAAQKLLKAMAQFQPKIMQIVLP